MGGVPPHLPWPHSHGRTTGFLVGPECSSQKIQLENTKLGKTTAITTVLSDVEEGSEVQPMRAVRLASSERAPHQQVSPCGGGKVGGRWCDKGKSAHYSATEMDSETEPACKRGASNGFSSAALPFERTDVMASLQLTGKR